ncbi:MAG: DUF3368 domain-containing protein, partial [Verrucomicrobia bacterium]|nr:DUF3368 domain-containing protein [Verrucomicrobiota bacterium]
MTGIIICDAGPLIALGSIGELRLLKELFVEVIVPGAVADEIQIEQGTLPGALAFRDASWLKILRSTSPPDPLLTITLDAGERSVIELARENPGSAV